MSNYYLFSLQRSGSNIAHQYLFDKLQTYNLQYAHELTGSKILGWKDNHIQVVSRSNGQNWLERWDNGSWRNYNFLTSFPDWRFITRLHYVSSSCLEIKTKLDSMGWQPFYLTRRDHWAQMLSWFIMGKTKRAHSYDILDLPQFEVSRSHFDQFARWILQTQIYLVENQFPVVIYEDWIHRIDSSKYHTTAIEYTRPKHQYIKNASQVNSWFQEWYFTNKNILRHNLNVVQDFFDQ